MTAVADTSFVVAVLNRKDIYHPAALTIYRRHVGDIYVPQPALAEIAYVFRAATSSVQTAASMVRLLGMKFALIAVEEVDVFRAGSLLEKYADTRLDFTDCVIAAVAERLEARMIYTLDHRDFRLFRPRHIEYFELLPKLNP